jgi:hypothetical protein
VSIDNTRHSLPKIRILSLADRLIAGLMADYMSHLLSGTVAVTSGKLVTTAYSGSSRLTGVTTSYCMRHLTVVRWMIVGIALRDVTPCNLFAPFSVACITDFRAEERSDRFSSTRRRLCHSSGGPGSSPFQVMWDLWWTKWHWAKFLLVFRFPMPILIPPTAPHPSLLSVIQG